MQLLRTQENKTKGMQEMNNALADSGCEAIVKLRIAEALRGKRVILLPVNDKDVLVVQREEGP